ncbi:MAG: hypothetical protein M3N45_14585 [Actinomycetota bacterium]|nr:hypothetical protein [Actinomycetota bacterium]
MDQLDALIDKRAKQNAAEREREAMYAQSVRRYHERQRERNRQLWRTYHLERAECLERTAASLAAEHRFKAEALAGSNLARSKPEPPQVPGTLLSGPPQSQ